MVQKLPYGILDGKELKEKFSEEPKKAAKQFFESKVKTKVLDSDLEDYFPHKNFQKWMNEFGIALINLKLKNVEREEEELIYAARTYKEMVHFLNVLKNREDILKNYESYKRTFDSSEKLKGKIEEKIKNIVENIAPNLSYLLGPVLAATLIAQARGLKNLAKMPASKIQILGAERSMFRYLKEEKKDRLPKYGIIYLSHYIQEGKKENRGKIARALSSKIMFAARLDYFSGDFEGDKLKERIEKEIKNL